VIPKPTPREKHTHKRRAKRTVRQTQKKATLERCRRLWSLVIKKKRKCVFLGKRVGDKLHVQCAGGLQAMHAFGKKAHPSVRFETWNGFCGCGRVHAYYTWQPHRWEEFLRKTWGEELYQKRYRQACRTAKLDLEEVARRLEREL